MVTAGSTRSTGSREIPFYLQFHEFGLHFSKIFETKNASFALSVVDRALGFGLVFWSYM
jgi:hypothetical protein